jgi:molybdopterin converting factor subunit 1
MKVRVMYFASLRDLFGCSEENLTLEPGATLEVLAQSLSLRAPRLREQLASIAWGLNFEFASIQATLQEGDEVALLPPVSGGRR